MWEDRRSPALPHPFRFYDYADGKRDGLWPGPAEAFGTGTTEIPLADMVERMLFAEAIESVKCLDENVLRSVPM